MKTRGLIKILVQKLHRSGVTSAGKETENTRRGKKRNSIARSHGFRKFVTTNMIRAKINAEAREMLLGHSIGLSDAYSRPDESEVLQEYLKAVDLLTINEENRLKRKVEQLTVEKSKVDALAEQIERIKNLSIFNIDR